MGDPHLLAELVSLALVVILFDGGAGLGAARPRHLWRPIVGLGLVGTLLVTAGLAAGAHWLLDFGWYPALLLGAAFAPTDPAVVFALIRESHTDRSAVGIVLEGESGANDPVGIALVAALLAVGEVSGHALVEAGGRLLQQLAVGAAVGLAAGWVAKRVNSPVALATAFAAYGLAVLGGGSGFLAAFGVGVARGARGGVPVLVVRGARLAAFALLGLSLHPEVLVRWNVWVPGLALGALAAFVVRPAAAALCLWRSGLAARERVAVAWIGLKGAVPLLLGLQLVVHDAPDAQRLYGVVAIAVLFSLVVQGGTVAPLMRRLTSPS
jgi:cell volume regulation protein A